MNVLKRDGITQQLFMPEKIGNAIRKANAAIPESVRISEKNIIRIQDEITAECESNPDHLYTIKEIQRMVETRLIKLKAVDIAIEYISYRKEHDIKRDEHAQMMKNISKKFLALDISKDNANMDEASFSGREGAAKDYLAKKYALDYLMSDLAKNNHINNEIYTHDLSSYAVGDHNCLAIPYDHLLGEGFDTRNTDIRASGSMNTASQLIAVIAQLQSLQQFGGVSSGHIDTTLKPFIRKSFWWYYKVGLWFVSRLGKENAEKAMEHFPKNTSIDSPDYKVDPDAYAFAMFMTEHECHQGMEALYHNLNSLQSRSGGQLPFTSINYGTDVTPEGRMIVDNILDVSKEGLGKLHRTSIFPCGIFQCRESLNMDPASPLYSEFRKALESTSKRLYPNYVNLDWSVQQAGIRKDRMFKRSVLDSLTEDETEKLKSVILDDPVQGDRLGLHIENDEVRVVQQEYPAELNSTMGCVDGKSSISYCEQDGAVVTRHFEQVWTYLAGKLEVKKQQDGVNDYIDNPGIKIWDHVAGRCVEVYRIIRNTQSAWFKVTLSNGFVIHATDDHPFEVEGKGIVLASSLREFDRMKVSDIVSKQTTAYVKEIEAYTDEKYSYDVTTETEHFTVNGIWSHNCRTWNGYDINFEDDYRENVRSVLLGNKLPSWTQISGMQKDGRGNVCPVTLILPTLAMEVKKNHPASAALVEDFLTYLDKKIHEAKNMLLERFEYMCQQSPKSASFMYDNHLFVGYKPEKGIQSALRHGTLVIGQLGLAECLQILVGCDHTDPKGMAVAHRIEALFRDRCNEFKNFYRLNFGVYYTPAESLCYTAMTKFKERFGVIPNVSDHSFMTNSIHVPVWIKMDPIQKIDIEAELVNYSSGGCITYVELDASVSHNIPALETIVRYAMKKDIPYFAINVPNDQCLDCGYVGDINDVCPICGSDRNLKTRRVTGYLSVDYPVSTNPGKQSEIETRVQHK